jgi:hypothetical protein
MCVSHDFLAHKGNQESCEQLGKALKQWEVRYAKSDDTSDGDMSIERY